jgi:hypothetical protein
MVAADRATPMIDNMHTGLFSIISTMPIPRARESTMKRNSTTSPRTTRAGESLSKLDMADPAAITRKRIMATITLITMEDKLIIE